MIKRTTTKNQLKEAFIRGYKAGLKQLNEGFEEGGELTPRDAETLLKPISRGYKLDDNVLEAFCDYVNSSNEEVEDIIDRCVIYDGLTDMLQDIAPERDYDAYERIRKAVLRKARPSGDLYQFQRTERLKLKRQGYFVEFNRIPSEVCLVFEI